MSETKGPDFSQPRFDRSLVSDGVGNACIKSACKVCGLYQLLSVGALDNWESNHRCPHPKNQRYRLTRNGYRVHLAKSRSNAPHRDCPNLHRR